MTLGTGLVRRGDAFGGVLVLTAGLAILALTRSALTMAYLNVRYADQVDPWSRAVSYYAFVDGGRRFAVSLVVLAAATVLVLAGLAWVGVRLGARVVAFAGVWCVSLVLCAVFPTDNGKRIVSTAGMVHQVAGASLFVSLPLAALALAARLRAHWVGTARLIRRMAVAAMVLAGAYLAARLPDLVPWVPGMLDGRGISGLVQRVLFGLEAAMLFTLAVRLLRVAFARRVEVPG